MISKSWKLMVCTLTVMCSMELSIAQVSGDNFCVNGICGFVESFVGNYHCRHCKMHSNHMWYSSTERPECLRTQEDYEVDVAVNDPSITGVKPPCLLNDISNFHLTKNFSPDIMHKLHDPEFWKLYLVSTY